MKGKTGKMESCGAVCKDTGCGCKCHHMGKKMKGLAVLLIGLILLAKYRGWLTPLTADTLWTLILCLIGIKMLVKSMCNCCGTCK